MFTCTIDGPSDRPRLTLQGSLTMDHAQEIHAILTKQVLASSSMIVDFGHVDKIDLSFIQILLALLKVPNQDVFFAPIPDSMRELATLVGASSLMKELASKIEDNA